MYNDVRAKYRIYDKSTITADVVFRPNKGLCQLLYDDLST
jgi:hypothetical protein